MREAWEKAGLYTAQGRVRFSMYGTRRYKIKGLDYVDYDSHRSIKQAIQRNYFRTAIRCFNEQPETGGAVPPEAGPRDRSWWFGDAIGEEMYYINWLMLAW